MKVLYLDSDSIVTEGFPDDCSLPDLMKLMKIHFCQLCRERQAQVATQIVVLETAEHREKADRGK